MGRFILGLVVGIAAFASLGLTYKIGHCDVDVRLVTVDGHDYVVAATGSGYAHYGSGVGIIHHFGCRKCNQAGR